MNELQSKEFLYTIHTELHDRPKLRDALSAILKGLAEGHRFILMVRTCTRPRGNFARPRGNFGDVS